MYHSYAILAHILKSQNIYDSAQNRNYFLHIKSLGNKVSRLRYLNHPSSSCIPTSIILLHVSVLVISSTVQRWLPSIQKESRRVKTKSLPPMCQVSLNSFQLKMHQALPLVTYLLWPEYMGIRPKKAGTLPLAVFFTVQNKIINLLK